MKTVYFIQAESGPVKIGCSSVPKDRLRAYQGCHYEKLRIMRLLPGNHCMERWLHRRFADLRIRGEWFQFNPLMKIIIPPEEASLSKPYSYDFVKELRENGKTYAEIGHLLGVSRQRVHQIYRYDYRAQRIAP